MPFIRVHDCNILFVHIPRTGGTTVEHWMRGLGDLKLFSYSTPRFSKITPQHLRYADICELLGDGYFDYSFAIVRNPFDRLASEYRLHALQAQKNGIWKGAPRFSTWLENKLDSYSKNSWAEDNHIRPQWEFLSKAVKVFKYEDGVLTALAEVARQIGVPAPAEIGHELATSDVDAKAIFDIPDVERAVAFYARDFEHLGYSKTPHM
ncbi:MAG: sulfotransferase family 2 domain-containing protein [Rhizomicrobium sp.]